MKSLLALLICLALPALIRADEPTAPAIAADRNLLTAEQLEQLVGPIALYPDALIALMLPAATAPADIVLAARYLKDDGDPAAATSRSWDESVKSLVHYAAVVKWMDDNLTWTKQLGEAFRDQPAEVMQAIQRMRAKARAAGTLTDSPEQQVVFSSDAISIVPAQANYLYVPYYDPVVVYAPRPAFYGTTTFISYSSPFAVGAWLSYDCDWNHRTVWVADRHRWASRNNHDWRNPVFPGQPGYAPDPNRHPWRPPSNSPRMPVVNVYHRDPIARPAPVDATPRPAYTFNNAPTPDHRDDSRDRPQRTDARPRNPNFVGPVAPASNVANVVMTSAAPTMSAPSPAPGRRGDTGRDRPNADYPNRAIAFQNSPTTRPAIAPVGTAPAPQPPANYSYSPAPATRIMPAFVGPVVPSMAAQSAPPAPQMHMPGTFAPNAAPAPIAPPAQPPPEGKRGVNDGGEKKQVLN